MSVPASVVSVAVSAADAPKDVPPRMAAIAYETFEFIYVDCQAPLRGFLVFRLPIGPRLPQGRNDLIEAHRIHDLVRGSARPYADRKSTRLNSSHLGISYAVFC